MKKPGIEVIAAPAVLSSLRQIARGKPGDWKFNLQACRHVIFHTVFSCGTQLLLRTPH
jgi:hypothetical protein